MATTIPFPFREHHDPLRCDPKTNDLVDTFIERYESALWDSDVAADGYDQGYYTGEWGAFADVLLDILDIPNEEWDRYNNPTPPDSTPAQ